MKTEAKDWKIKPAWTISERTGREVRCGWDLFCGDDWSQRYQTKREADAALVRVEGVTP